MAEYVKIPRARIGVLIGEDGKTKKQLAEETQTAINVDTEGLVTIQKEENARDPLAEWVARDTVKAIGRGFSPQKAMRLVEEEGTMLDIIELDDYVGKGPKGLERVKGRIIGQEGRARRCIETLTKSDISIYGKTVSILGPIEAVPVAHEAIIRLVEGQMHTTVFRFLERKRRELKIV